MSLTGGGGFTFEDYVAARLLLDVLIRRAPFGAARGVIRRVHWQARDLKWGVDDLVCELERPGADGALAQVALSLKQNRQVTEGGFPPTFVEVVWRHALGVDDVPKVGEGEHAIGLVVGALADRVHQAWSTLQAQALKTDPDRLVLRLREDGEGSQSSATARVLFASLECPTALSTAGKTDATVTARLLRSVFLLRFDFLTPTSSSEEEAIATARSTLESSDRQEAERLWMHLIGYAARLRGVGGSAGAPEILADLGGAYALSDDPDYRGDWKALRQLTVAELEDVRTAISDLPAIPREGLHARIEPALKSNTVCLLVGESGAGKSALAKNIAVRGYPSRTIWIPASILNGETSVDVRGRLGLSHALDEVLGSARVPTLVVVDGAERLTVTARKRLGRLARALRSTEAPIRFLFTVLSDAARSLVDGISDNDQAGRGVEVIDVGHPTDAEFTTLLASAPSLHWGRIRREVRPALQNLKTLELVMQAIRRGSQFDGGSLTTMSELIERLWTAWIGDGDGSRRRTHVLLNLGVHEAQSLAAGVACRDLGLEAADTLEELARTDLVRIRQERVYFTHDLVGDWARLRVLIEEQGAKTALLKYVAKPRWHRAIRLYGQRLLDQGPNGVQQWQQLIQDFDGGDAEAKLARGLLLDSAVLASRANSVIEGIWLPLVSNEGRLLRDLLDRFLYVATLPEPDLAARIGPRIEVAAVEHAFRIPLGIYWGPVLLALHRHLPEVTQLAPDLAARTARLWLAWTPQEQQRPTIWRREAAEIAVAIAQETHARDELNDRGTRGEKGIFEALLYAAPDCPAAVNALCLEISHRRPLSAELQQRVVAKRQAQEAERRVAAEADPEREARRAYLSQTLIPRGPMRPQAAHGPSRRVNEAFADACMNADAFSGFARADATVACEVLLAVCIEEPTHEDPYGAGGRDDALGVRYWQAGYPAMWFQGPFLRFLREHSTEAVTFAIHLVNHATERWTAAQGSRQWTRGLPPVAPPALELRRGRRRNTYVGDDTVLRWNASARSGSGAVPNSLMALERYLYELMDANQYVGGIIGRLLDEGSSLAFIGVLTEVAKKAPQLLVGPLKALLDAPDLLHLDRQITDTRRGGYGDELTAWALGGTTETVKIAADWFGMKHRKTSLLDLETFFLLNAPNMAGVFRRIRKRWRRALIGREPEWLWRLTENLDPANYELASLPDGTKFYSFRGPKETAESDAQELAAIAAGLEQQNLPFRVRDWLLGKKPFPREQLPQLWQTARQLATSTNGPNDENPFRDPRNTLFALVATFLILAGSWTAEDPTRLAWCREQLASLPDEDPDRARSDGPSLQFETGYDAFVAEAGVVLLAGDRSDALARRLVARGVAAMRPGVTRATMTRAFLERHALGDDFARLQRLAMHWAAAQGAAREAKHRRLNTDRYIERRRTLVDSFVDGSMSAWRLTFEDADAEARAEGSELEAERDRPETKASLPPWIASAPIEPTLDEDTIRAAFGWIDLPAAGSVDESRAWANMVGEALAYVLSRRLPRKEGNGQERDPKWPDDFEAWVCDHVACAIVAMSAEDAAGLWRPVLERADRDHLLVQKFLEGFFFNGSQRASSIDAFTVIWRQMLLYALDAQSWASRSAYHLDDCVIALLGCGNASAFGGCAPADHVPDSVVPLFARAAQLWLRFPGVARRLAWLAAAPEGRVLLVPSLAWFAEGLEGYPSSRWEKDIAAALIQYLRAVWQNARESIRVDTSAQRSFERLLNLAAAHGGHEGLSLRDQVLDADRS